MLEKSLNLGKSLSELCKKALILDTEKANALNSYPQIICKKLISEILYNNRNVLSIWIRNVLAFTSYVLILDGQSIFKMGSKLRTLVLTTVVSKKYDEVSKSLQKSLDATLHQWVIIMWVWEIL